MWEGDGEKDQKSKKKVKSKGILKLIVWDTDWQGACVNKSQAFCAVEGSGEKCGLKIKKGILRSKSDGGGGAESVDRSKDKLVTFCTCT